jgi:hypothetical protein
MNTWLPIQYRGFWDVPRIFLVRREGVLLLFESAFRVELDDYSDSYRVYVLPDLKDSELPADWTQLAERASRFLGEIPIKDVRFDDTLRKQIESGVVDLLIRQAARNTA